MFSLIRCVLALICLLVMFYIWGCALADKLRLKDNHLPAAVLVGFFAYFIVMEIIFLPIVFLFNSLKVAVIMVCVVSVGTTLYFLWIGKKHVFSELKKYIMQPWSWLALLFTGGMAVVAVFQQYGGYDTTYYIGEMNAFLYYGKFWTRDAFVGLTETSEIPLHYALSCFYPLSAVLAYIFKVEARLMSMYTIRALCVVLFGCVAYTWGYGLFSKIEKNARRNAAWFVCICLLVCLFMTEYHSLAAFMMVRGYESKGFCAAVVAPMCTYALIKICRDWNNISGWRLLGVISWASMPIAMSSMAVIPLAIAVVGLTLMVCCKKFWVIFKRCLVCVIPNLILMVWYVLGTN